MEKNEVKIYGLNIAALVLGIVAITNFWLCIISMPSAILAIVFAAIGIKKSGKGMAIAGLVTGIVSIVLTLVMFGFIVLDEIWYMFDYDYPCYIDSYRNTYMDEEETVYEYEDSIF